MVARVRGGDRFWGCGVQPRVGGFRRGVFGRECFGGGFGGFGGVDIFDRGAGGCNGAKRGGCGAASERDGRI